MSHTGQPYTPLDFWQDLDTNKQRLQTAGEVAQTYQFFTSKYDVASTSNATPVVVTTTVANKFETGDKVFVVGTGDAGADAAAPWTITRISSTQFSLDTSTAGGGSSGSGSCYEAGAGNVAVLIDAVTMLGRKLGIVRGDTAADPLGSVTFGTLSVVTFQGANVFSGTSATQVQSGGSFQVNSGATLTSASATGVHLTGTQPAKTADPGANNLAVSTNQCKAWGNIAVGSGVTLNDGYNTSGVSTSGNNVVVAFARSMANADYAVTFGVEMLDTEVTSSGMVPQPFVNLTGAVKTASGFSFKLWNANAGSIINPASASSLVVNYTVLARQ